MNYAGIAVGETMAVGEGGAVLVRALPQRHSYFALARREAPEYKVPDPTILL